MSDETLSLGMDLVARDEASPAINAVRASLDELRKSALAIGRTIKRSLNTEFVQAMNAATSAATKLGADTTASLNRVATSIRADTAAMDAFTASVRAAAAAQRDLARNAGRGGRGPGGDRPPAPPRGPAADLRAIRQRWAIRERSAKAEVAEIATAQRAEANRARAALDDVARRWKVRQASQRDEVRHLNTVRREHQAMRREFQRRTREVYHQGRHAIRSINHPAFESAGFWLSAGAAFGVEAGKHLVEAAKQLDTVTTRYRMQPGVSAADAAKVREESLREGIRLGVDPAEVAKLRLQGVKDGLAPDVAKILPSSIQAAIQTMGGSLDKDGDELAKAVREASTVGWVKNAADARSMMNQIAGLSTFNGNDPAKMQQFLASGGIGRGRELGWNQQQTLAFGATLNGSGERTGFGSARLMAQLPEIQAGIVDKYRRAARSHENSEERRAALSGPRKLGYSGPFEMQQAFRTPEGVVSFLSRLQGLDEKTRAQIEKGYGLGPQFNAVSAEMGANNGERYHRALKRENELTGQNQSNDVLSQNSKTWSNSIEFMLDQLKAGTSAVQAELGDVIKDDILEPFTSWWVEISEALLDGGMKQDLHRAIQSFVQGLRFDDLTAALNSLRASVGTFDLSGFLLGVGQGLRTVTDSFAAIAHALGFAGDGSARQLGKLAAEILGLSIALRIASPVITLLSGIASGFMAIKAAVSGVSIAAKFFDLSSGLKALLGVETAAMTTGLIGLAGALTTIGVAVQTLLDLGILNRVSLIPKSTSKNDVDEWLWGRNKDGSSARPAWVDRLTGNAPVVPVVPQGAPNPTSESPADHWSRKQKFMHPSSYDGDDGLSWRDLLTKASYEPSNAGQVARDATVQTSRGVFEIRDSIDRLSTAVKASVLRGADVVGSGGGGGVAPGHGFSNMRYGRTSSGSYRSSPGGSGAGGGGGMTAVSKDLTPESRALLDTLASGEAPDYNVMNGGGRFSDYSHHPGGRAAGRYQFLPSTWKRVSSALGLKDFSPESQDKGAWWLAQQDYKTRTGRNLQADLASKDPSRIAAVGRALHSTWVSLNGSFGGKYDKYLGRQSSGGAVANGGGAGSSARGLIHGNLQIGGESFRYGSGGAGGSSSVPFGDYPINPDAPGAWGRAHNAMAVNGDGSIYDKSLGRMRTGIEMHEAHTAEMMTHGCLGFMKGEYGKLKSRVREMIAKTGHAYLHVGPNGATITPNKVEGADTAKAPATPRPVSPEAADTAHRVLGTTRPKSDDVRPSNDITADNSSVHHYHIHGVSDPKEVAKQIAQLHDAQRRSRWTDVNSYV